MNDGSPNEAFDRYIASAKRDPELQRRERQIASVTARGLNPRARIHPYALAGMVVVVFVVVGWVVVG